MGQFDFGQFWVSTFFFWTTQANSTWANWPKSSILCCVCVLLCVVLLCVVVLWFCVLCGCVLCVCLCVAVCCCVLVQDLGAPPNPPPPDPPPPPDRPKIRFFFLCRQFSFFLPSLGMKGVFLKAGTLNVRLWAFQICTFRCPGFGLSGCRAHFRAPVFKNTTEIPREDPKRGKKESVAGEGKKREISPLPPPFRPHRSGPTLRSLMFLGSPLPFGALLRGHPLSLPRLDHLPPEPAPHPTCTTKMWCWPKLVMVWPTWFGQIWSRFWPKLVFAKLGLATR